MEQPSPSDKSSTDKRPTATRACVRLATGELAELVYDPHRVQTQFAVWSGAAWALEGELSVAGERVVPFSPRNNLIRYGSLLLPWEPEEYGDEHALVAELRAYVHRYVDVSPEFELLSCYYVLLSWLYDAFNELPYLRLRGDYGSGKTRCLLVIGAVCYRPFFASGASTISPIFHTLDAFRGTLVMDEGDFRFTDEKAEITKILNNGNVTGMPVLRTVIGTKGEYDARAFQVFGPKLIATRGYYEDQALESRFLTEDMGARRLRSDIPINLPSSYKDEALHLRNKLLLYRFRNLDRAGIIPDLADAAIEPRLNQIFSPLLSVVSDEVARTALQGVARRYHEELVAERAMATEAQVLELIGELGQGRDTIPLRELAAAYARQFGESAEQRMSTRLIGHIVRRQLGLRTRKSNGVFVVPVPGEQRLGLLFRKYGLVAPSDDHAVDFGDVRDFARGSDGAEPGSDAAQAE
jgi:hypothetical protein